jgi:hypothetical protein
VCHWSRSRSERIGVGRGGTQGGDVAGEVGDNVHDAEDHLRARSRPDRSYFPQDRGVVAAVEFPFGVPIPGVGGEQAGGGADDGRCVEGFVGLTGDHLLVGGIRFTIPLYVHASFVGLVHRQPGGCIGQVRARGGAAISRPGGLWGCGPAVREAGARDRVHVGVGLMVGHLVEAGGGGLHTVGAVLGNRALHLHGVGDGAAQRWIYRGAVAGLVGGPSAGGAHVRRGVLPGVGARGVADVPLPARRQRPHGR